MGAQGFVGGLPQSVRGEVEGYGELLVLLDGSAKPLLAVLSHCWQCLGKSSWAKKGTVNGMFGFGGVRLR